MLTLWRTIEPRHLMLRTDHAALLEHLRVVTAPADRVAQGWLAAALSGQTGAALPLAAALRTAEALPDLAPSWLLWASLRDDLAAQLALAQCLLEEDAWPATVAARRDALQRRRLGLAWLSLSRVPRLTAALGWRQLADAAAKIPWADRPRDSIAVPAPSAGDGPTLRVIAGIGDEASREGQQLARVYASLTQPLPLLGGKIAPDALATALRLEFPAFGEAIDLLTGDFKLQRRLGRPWLRCQPLLLIGPPGVGKTRFCRRFAAMAGLGYGELSSAGGADTRALLGTARGWSSAQPCLPLLTMQRTASANPILAVDEIEKTGWSRHHGHIHDALLRLLERQSARHWFDEALLAEADLSQITWLLMANEADGLPAALMSRVIVISIQPPPAEAAETMVQSLLRDVAEEYGVAAGDLPPLTDEAVEHLTEALKRGRSPRRIRRAIIAGLTAAPDRPRLH